jgi:survival motor neuron protein
MAVFSEDGLLYPAEIIKIYEKNKCLVRYLYYLNEEEKNLDDLIEYDENEIENLDENEENNKHENKTSKNDQKNSSKCKQKKVNLEEKFKNVNLSDSIEPPPLPFFPPLLSPPPTSNNLNENINQSLHSMLMSWYMAGYHTGFYHGLVETDKNNAKRS